MKIREFNASDLDALLDIYKKQGFQYPFPDLTDPIFVSKLVLENGLKRPEQAIAARLTCELYLLMDPDVGDPYSRWEKFQKLHAAMEQDIASKGLEDGHCWLPPGLEKNFGRRIQRLGWVRDDKWTPFVKYVAVKPEVKNGER